MNQIKLPSRHRIRNSAPDEPHSTEYEGVDIRSPTEIIIIIIIFIFSKALFQQHVAHSADKYKANTLSRVGPTSCGESWHVISCPKFQEMNTKFEIETSVRLFLEWSTTVTVVSELYDNFNMSSVDIYATFLRVTTTIRLECTTLDESTRVQVMFECDVCKWCL